MDFSSMPNETRQMVRHAKRRPTYVYNADAKRVERFIGQPMDTGIYENYLTVKVSGIKKVGRKHEIGAMIESLRKAMVSKPQVIKKVWQAERQACATFESPNDTWLRLTKDA